MTPILVCYRTWVYLVAMALIIISVGLTVISEIKDKYNPELCVIKNCNETFSNYTYCKDLCYTALAEGLT